ncbi:MAG: hypothetical protein EZS26_001659 [Candidatus Ordinivivax streblomastigis]|uniref:Uncharacterized protein n=1 Tax=Candidatus Ordinivivax streblomastigis TaxID=2540710 RepID=A0A5M8P0Y7_9BACT|nr:MAG: hypothetical protein EZS26_001659 [Candidatus Ordinivivax streblomastigis]
MGSILIISLCIILLPLAVILFLFFLLLSISGFIKEDDCWECGNQEGSGILTGVIGVIIFPIGLIRAYVDKIDDIFSDLPKGYLLFDVPQFMKLGKQTILEVILSKQLLNLIDEFVESKSIEEIPIGTVMGVKLIGDNFQIKELNTEFQIVNNDKTTWKWQIKPLKTGESNLFLRVSIKSKIENYLDEVFEKDIYTRNVIVKKNIAFSIKQFFKINWKWLITTLVGSGLILSVLKLLGLIN